MTISALLTAILLSAPVQAQTRAAPPGRLPAVAGVALIAPAAMTAPGLTSSLSASHPSLTFAPEPALAPIPAALAAIRPAASAPDKTASRPSVVAPAVVKPAEATPTRAPDIPDTTAKAAAGRSFDGNAMSEGDAGSETGGGADAVLSPLYPSAAAFFDSAPDWRAAHPDAKVLTFIRHGESLSNVFQYVQTYDSFSPLTRQGDRQRQALLRFIAERRIVFDRYVTSDLERAHETLSPLARRAGKDPEVLKRFREAIIQPIGGIPVRLGRLFFPGRLERFVQDPESYLVPGLYSGRKVKECLRRFLDDIAASGPRSTVVASHGMTILLGIMEALDIPWKNYAAVFAALGNPPNVSLTVLAFHPEDGRWRLLVAPDSSYLDPSLKARTTGWAARLLERGRYYSLAIGRVAATPFQPRRRPPLMSDYAPTWRTFFPPSRRQLERISRAHAR